MNEPSSTVRAKEGTSLRTSTKGNEQRDDQDVSAPMEMEFSPKNREKLYSDVRVSGMPEVMITHDSKELFMPDRRSKSHNN